MAPRLLAALLVATSPPALTFDWSAPPQCPSAESVRARLGAELTGQARATVVPGAEGFQLQVEVDSSSRTLAATTCEEAADAAILIIRLALTAKPATPPPAAAVAPAVTEASEPGPRWSVRAAALAAADVLWLPQPFFRFGASVEVQRGSLAVVLDGSTSLSRRYVGGPTADAAVDVRLPFALEAGGCWLFESGRWRGGPCVTAGPSWLSVQGLNVTDPKQSTSVLWGGGPSARLAVGLGQHVELRAAVGARFGAQPVISFDGDAPVVQAKAVDVTLSLGAGARF